MEVFGRDLDDEGKGEELVQDGDDVATACYGERSILGVLSVVSSGRSACAYWRAEVLLHVDEHERGFERHDV